MSHSKQYPCHFVDCKYYWEFEVDVLKKALRYEQMLSMSSESAAELRARLACCSVCSHFQIRPDMREPRS